jgi:hypothetical protein
VPLATASTAVRALTAESGPDVPAKLDLVAVHEISERLGVARGTVSVWIGRGWPSGRGGQVTPPEPVAVIKGCGAVFEWKDVKRWAKATGRL